MTKPVYEIPIGDDSFPPAPGRRSASAAPSSSSAAPAQSFAAPVVPTTSAAGYPPPGTPGFTPAPGANYAATPVALPAAAPAAAYPPPAAAYPPPAVGLPPAPTPSFAAPPAPLLSDLSPSVGLGQAGSDPDLVAALNAVVTAGASDLHVGVDSAPSIRVDGGIRPIPGVAPWDSDKVNFALLSIMSDLHKEVFAKELELDFAYTLSETSRFRVNVYMQRDVMGAAFRLIPTEIKQLAALGVPEKIGNFAQLARGLVLVTGPTGSGKSTTLAALIDLVNSTRADHIVTVEDPIEFLHSNKKSLVHQREVGHDTHSFAAALKHVLRQDPDVILIGELRDLETISVALTAAETGHLVFATLHTQDAPQTIDRVIDVFPPHQQGQVRAQLAATLQGVVCQTLVKRATGKGRVVVTEVLVTTPAVANLIREGKSYQIPSAMQAGRDLGMHTMDQHLADLVNAGMITHHAALEKAHDIEGLERLIHRADPNGTPGSDNSSYGVDYGDASAAQVAR